MRLNLIALPTLLCLTVAPAVAQSSRGQAGWAQEGKGREAFVADSTEYRATRPRMGDDTDAQLATCLEARFGWRRATLFEVPPGCQLVEVRVVSTPHDAKESALLSALADSIARQLQRYWTVAEDEHTDTTRVTWSVDRNGDVAGLRRLGASHRGRDDDGRFELLVSRVGAMPLPMRVRKDEWRPLQLMAQFNGPCVAAAAPSEVSADQPYFEFQVEKQVTTAPGSPQPRYPDMLKSANVEGEVLAQFVVDTTGRADMSTFKVLKSSHELFTQAVRDALPTMIFYPAEIGGRKVKQLLQQPFTFASPSSR